MHRDLTAIVYTQIPRGIVDKLRMRVQTDAFLMRPELIVHDDKNREYRTHLEPMEHDGVVMNLRVPEVFIAQLCAVV